VALSAVVACERTPSDEPTDGVQSNAPSLPEWAPLDTLPMLAESAAADWQLLPLPHIPPYFRLVSWKDPVTLWGLASCNPVEVRTDTPAYHSWDVTACGAIAPAPDGARLAWSDGKGGLWVGERGAQPRALLGAGTPAPAGEGDPTGRIQWSPDGTRVLTSWAAEWNAHYALLPAEGGEPSPIDTRLDGYYLLDAWGWIANDQILFSAHAVQDQQGRSEYSESGGPRKDLAVWRASEATLQRVTSAPDGTMLEPLARWGERILVGERPRAADLYQRYWSYDPADWSRVPVELPAASAVEVNDTTRVLLLDRIALGQGARARVFLWESGDDEVRPLLEMQEGSVAWSPDGRRIAFTTSIEEPVAGAPGSFQTRYRAYVLTPR
jgi:hypothetical protein